MARVNRLNDTQREPTDTSNVTIYLDEADIPGKHTELARIEISGDASFTNQKDYVSRARKETAEIGGNGVLYENWNPAGAGEVMAAALFGGPVDDNATMIAIYVENPKQEGGIVGDTTVFKTAESPTDSTSNR